MKKIISQNLKIAFFIFAIQFTVATLCRYNKFNVDTLSRTSLFSAATTIVFMLFFSAYQIFYIRTNKISLRDFDINPRQSTTFTIKQSLEQTKDIIENLLPTKLNSCKFKFDKKNGIFKSKTGMTIRSWGETIEIKLTEIENSKTQLFVVSIPILKTTLIDYGKSSMNIHKIKLAFDQNGR